MIPRRGILCARSLPAACIPAHTCGTHTQHRGGGGVKSAEPVLVVWCFFREVGLYAITTRSMNFSTHTHTHTHRKLNTELWLLGWQKSVFNPHIEIWSGGCDDFPDRLGCTRTPSAAWTPPHTSPPPGGKKLETSEIIVKNGVENGNYMAKKHL